MKPVKAWAIVQDGNIVCELATTQYDIYRQRAAALDVLRGVTLIGSKPRIVYVEIRELRRRAK